MSFFPRALVNSDPYNASFTPLFRLLDDFDTYSRGSQHPHRGHLTTKTFAPKFDIKEEAQSYVLEGELPGIEQKDVEIQFTDPQTISIRGRTERQYTSGTEPGRIEALKSGEAITESGEQSSSHKATVEDEDAAEKAAVDGKANNAVATQNNEQELQQQQQQQPQSKYWVSERSVGEFSRSFSFPDRVDQDAVTASMKNGVLSIVVPKAKKYESRKITIN
jgi:HSP20 family protein